MTVGSWSGMGPGLSARDKTLHSAGERMSMIATNFRRGGLARLVLAPQPSKTTKLGLWYRLPPQYRKGLAVDFVGSGGAVCTEDPEPPTADCGPRLPYCGDAASGRGLKTECPLPKGETNRLESSSRVTDTSLVSATRPLLPLSAG